MKTNYSISQHFGSTRWVLPPDQESLGLMYSYVFVKYGQIRLKITGSGKIPGKGELQPWLPHRNKISEIWIGEGITAIGEQAFMGYGHLLRIWLPSSLQTVSALAFTSCNRLEKITYAGCLSEFKRISFHPGAIPKQFRLLEEKNRKLN